ncbi:MAG: hypothetical protein ACOYIP_07075 [Coriobacteriales bacterium]
MTDGIRCPKCGSTDIASVLYGFPAFNEELRRKIDAGDVVLNGCEIESGVPLYPHECKACGLRFDGEAFEQGCARTR